MMKPLASHLPNQLNANVSGDFVSIYLLKILDILTFLL